MYIHAIPPLKHWWENEILHAKKKTINTLSYFKYYDEKRGLLYLLKKNLFSSNNQSIQGREVLFA